MERAIMVPPSSFPMKSIGEQPISSHNMKTWKFFGYFITLIWLFAAGFPVVAVEVKVFAAASLTDSLKEIGATYQKKTGDRIVFNLGASSTLARQIAEGAPADIFFSADEAKMDGLETKGWI